METTKDYNSAIKEILMGALTLSASAKKYNLSKGLLHDKIQKAKNNIPVLENMKDSIGMNEVNVSGCGNEPELMPSSNSLGDKATNEISGSGLELVAVPAVQSFPDCLSCSRIGDLSAELATEKDNFRRLYLEGKDKISELDAEILRLSKITMEFQNNIRTLEKDKADLSAGFENDKNSLIEAYEKTIKILKRKVGDVVIVAITIGMVSVGVVGYFIIFPVTKKILLI